VGREERAVDDHVRSGRAQVRGRPLPRTASPEQLHLDRDREVLIFPHRLGPLPVNHDPAVPQRPRGAAFGLLADEPVLDSDSVVRIGIAIEDVAELRVEGGVLVVGHDHPPILHPERVAEVVAELVARNLYGPALEILAVEQLDPVLAVGIVLRDEGKPAERGRQRDRSHERNMSGHPVNIHPNQAGGRGWFGPPEQGSCVGLRCARRGRVESREREPQAPATQPGRPVARRQPFAASQPPA
jgi:hypothetical protein